EKTGGDRSGDRYRLSGLVYFAVPWLAFDETTRRRRRAHRDARDGNRTRCARRPVRPERHHRLLSTALPSLTRLLVAQSNDRIDFRRAPRRYVTRDRGHADQ